MKLVNNFLYFDIVLAYIEKYNSEYAYNFIKFHYHGIWENFLNKIEHLDISEKTAECIKNFNNIFTDYTNIDPIIHGDFVCAIKMLHLILSGLYLESDIYPDSILEIFQSCYDQSMALIWNEDLFEKERLDED